MECFFIRWENYTWLFEKGQAFARKKCDIFPISFFINIVLFDGGEIYEYNAKGILTGGLENENTIKALEFITDLYTEYGLPYQVSSFFNEFRYGKFTRTIYFPEEINVEQTTPLNDIQNT